jgi:hypothetical protein
MLLLSQITVEQGKREDYQKLEQFHYREGKAVIKKIFAAKLDDKVIGVIVYVAPHPKLKGRSTCLPRYKFPRMTTENMKLINQDFIRIGRVVVHPKIPNNRPWSQVGKRYPSAR